MPATSAPPDSATALLVPVDSIAPGPGSARLAGRSTQGRVTVTVPVEPDVPAARRWAATVRRVDRVTVRVDGRGAACEVRGQRTRLPFTTGVPLALGLGLAVLGAPLVVSAANS